MMLAEAALNQCWHTFPNVQRLLLPSGSGFFDVTKRDANAMDVTTSGNNAIPLPKTAFIKTLAYLIEKGHLQDKPCAIGNNYSNPSPLAQTAAVNGTQTIHYVLPILQAMGLVGIDNNRPNKTWLL